MDTQIVHRVKIVVYEVLVHNENEEEEGEILFEAPVGPDLSPEDSYTYDDVIAEYILGMTEEEVVERNGGCRPGALEAQIAAMFS